MWDRKVPISKGLIGIGLLCFAVTLTGCGVITGDSKDKHGTLIIGTHYPPQILDPAKTVEYSSANVICNIYDTLLRIDSEDGEVKPCLAKSWEISDDMMDVTFYLRPGVSFHDGTPLNAEAVKISFERQIDAESSFYSEEPPNLFASSYEVVDSISIVDSLTVQFRLKRPFAPFLKSLAMSLGASIVSPSALETYGSEFGKNPVGTGPFEFESWEKDKIILQRNEIYWDRAPVISKIVYKILPEPSVGIENILDGSLDVLTPISPTYMERLRSSQDVIIASRTGMYLVFVGFNCRSQALSDPRLRKAIALGIDKRKLVNIAFHGTASVAKGLVSQEFLDCGPELEQPSYNSSMAEKLLSEIGYGEALNLKLLIHYSSLERAGIAPLAVQRYLKEVGIDVKISYFTSWDEYNEALKDPSTDMFIDGWISDNGDLDNVFYPLFHSKGMGEGNLFRYSNAEVDRLLEDARSTFDEETRRDLYREAQRIIIRDLPCVFIAHIKQICALNKRVQNFKVSPFGVQRFDKVTISNFIEPERRARDAYQANR